MYRSDPVPEENRAPGGGVRPTVRLLNATPDPLGSLAALSGIYEGRVIRSLSEVSDDERRAAWTEMNRTVLNGPLEAIHFHFLVEGVTRAFTHQAVRSRFSFFAQESLRFAVVDGENWLDRSSYPPSLAAEPARMEEDHMGNYKYASPEERDYALKRDVWDDAIITAQNAYQRLIDAGIPAEDARGVMPHAISTRYHWIVSLRTLLSEAGKRLCTQAQFEWRLVMAEVVKAIRDYSIYPKSMGSTAYDYEWASYAWQFELMADALQPICYQEGRCGFMARFDRGCTIRPRVERFAANNVPSSSWDTTGQYDLAGGPIEDAFDRPLLPIHPAEWLADPNAARVPKG
jgi:flavin-dependent thymidylate synthase